MIVLVSAIGTFNISGASGATCTIANNIEAIIDDSGSMSFSDANVNRSEALKILISKSGNANKTLGAVEFGSQLVTTDPPAATTVFAPAVIGPNAAAMNGALTTNILADHYSTDYNAAFAQAKTDNPNANARIFLTDGGHNEGDYTNGHQGGPPTYVIGLGIGDTGSDAARLQQIATETGGKYYPNVTTGNVSATMNEIDAALNCQKISQTFTDTFSSAGQSKTRSTRISSSTRSIDLVMTWTSPLDVFTIGSLKLKTSRGTTISVARKRLKITRVAGKTFLNVHVSGLKRGKLRFKLRAKTLASGVGAGVTLTTQATQSRRR